MLRTTVSFSLLVFALVAQPQMNAPTGALSVNGTGRLDAAGMLRPSNAALPPGPGTAPLLHHVSAPRVSYQVRIDGGASQFYGLFLALAGFGPLPVGPGGAQFVEIDPFTAINVFEGLLSPTGQFVLPPNPGFVFGTPTFFLQAVVTDPASPGGFRLTASISTEIRDDIETVNRNFFDAAFQTTDNPAYVDSLVTTGFLLDGAAPVGGSVATSLATLTANQSIVGAEWLSVGSNGTPASPPPAGGPVMPGQSVSFRTEVILTYDDGCTAPARERVWLYDYRVQESGSNWRMDGNQRAVDIDLYLDFINGPTIGGMLDICLGAVVSNPANINGGITGVMVAGPNLPAPMVPLSMVPTLSGGVVFGDELFLSTAPLIETPTGPRDVYTFSVSFANGAQAGPYSIPLRAALDPTIPADRAQILANLIPVGITTVSLANAGTPSAAFTLAFNSGSPIGTPLGPLHSAFAVTAIPSLNPVVFRIPAIPVDPTIGTQSVTVCAPGYPAGLSEFTLERSDVFGCGYYIDLSGVF